jgi:hypothetical protein
MVYPERYRSLQGRNRTSPEGKLLSKIFREDVDD